ncbi:Clavaminate synthase-like protein [Xylaria bambusicola]|uniref:Clavaminate synthase-like protein n=1 Tax=Xylaria bambusicola TaxID=326684 RepID=UPI0020088BAD|nr:Clavaminate synthase-like protein [Xylaria bambusicola]KAI0503402.1 Clavaminate synthase-like protein [Xylaria bambusicola]
MKSWTTANDQVTGLVAFGGDKLESFSDTTDCLKGFQAWLARASTSPHSHFLENLISRLLESAENSQSRFLQFDAPLSLIIQASQYNRGKEIKPSQRVSQLYIAQSDIRSLPSALGKDLPVPDIVGRVGKGDIYNSSIWLGLQPTYTPLHRDPNPNLFCQLVGSKAVRLLRPRAGLSVFEHVRRSLGAVGNSRFRGPEMMDGPEREGLHRAVWGDPGASREVWQATLGPGDALFIPQGWWHSVRSVGHEAELNASANWWFR